MHNGAVAGLVPLWANMADNTFLTVSNMWEFEIHITDTSRYYLPLVQWASKLPDMLIGIKILITPSSPWYMGFPYCPLLHIWLQTPLLHLLKLDFFLAVNLPRACLCLCKPIVCTSSCNLTWRRHFITQFIIEFGCDFILLSSPTVWQVIILKHRCIHKV